MKAEYVLCEPHELKPGQWTVYPLEGITYACCPNGLLANLDAHTKHVDLHGDVPILTISPSILCTGAGTSFHGFIENGVWLGEDRLPVTVPAEQK